MKDLTNRCNTKESKALLYTETVCSDPAKILPLFSAVYRQREFTQRYKLKEKKQPFVFDQTKVINLYAAHFGF